MSLKQNDVNIDSDPLTSRGSFLITLGIGFAILTILESGFRFWVSEPVRISPIVSVLLALLLALVGIKRAGPKWWKHFFPSMRALKIILLLLFLSDWLCRDYSFLAGPEIRSAILFFTLIFWLFVPIESHSKVFKFILAGAALMLTACFFDAANGKLLFSDDHSVVFYRLSLLKENFPNIPFYNPFWNGGIEARDFFATGTLNLFFLAAPIIYFTDLAHSYTYIIGAVLFIFAPLVSWYAAKLERLPEPAPSIAGILTLTTSLYWYRWALKYGSMGFITSTLFVLLNLILVRILFSKDRELTKGQAVLLVISMTLMLFWSLTGVIFVPALIIAAFQIRNLWKKRYFKKIVIALCAINIPWIILFLSVSNVQSFVSLKKQPFHQVVNEGEPILNADPGSKNGFTKATVKGGGKKLSPKSILHEVRDYAIPANPLLIIFGFAGIFFLRRDSRKLFAATTIWLLSVGTIIAPLKPQLELERMLIILGFVLALPASSLIAVIIRKKTLLSSLIPGFACAAIFSVGGIIYNRSIEHYFHAEQYVYDLAKDINAHTGEGRAVFAGFVLHELNNGHLAPLMQLAKKPMVASSPYHNVWRYTELIPRDFQLRKDTGTEDFFDLMNATVVIAHEERWRKYFFSRPEKYTFVARHGVFNLFKRNFVSNYFVSGSGTVINQSSNSVTLSFTSESATIKFNYFSFLKSTGCVLSGQEMEGNFTFIHLEQCPLNTPITISEKSGLRRIL